MHEFPRARIIRIGVASQVNWIGRSSGGFGLGLLRKGHEFTAYQLKRRSYRARGTTDLWVSRIAAGMANRHEPNHATDPIRSQALRQEHCPQAVESVLVEGCTSRHRGVAPGLVTCSKRLVSTKYCDLKLPLAFKDGSSITAPSAP